MKAKKILAAIAMFGICLLCTACSFTEVSYKSAQNLMSKGKYAEAAEKFSSLGSYEDAVKLTVYCKACALCEAGDFLQGINALKSLEDYRDSEMRVSYYTARSLDDWSVDTTQFEWMEKAIAIYEKNPLYLDSTERIAALNKRTQEAKAALYEKAVQDAEKGSYMTAQESFSRLKESQYKDSEKRYVYYEIRSDENKLDENDEDAIIAVAKRYTKLDNYLDCVERAVAMTEKADAIVTKKSAKIIALVNNGKYDEAEQELTSFGTYGNEQALSCYYFMGEKLLSQERYLEAISAFNSAVGYQDALSRAYAIRYEHLGCGRIAFVNSKNDDCVYILKNDGRVGKFQLNVGGSSKEIDEDVLLKKGPVIAIATCDKNDLWALKADGTVVPQTYHMRDYNNDIVAIGASINSTSYVLFLREDGTCIKYYPRLNDMRAEEISSYGSYTYVGGSGYYSNIHTIVDGKGIITNTQNAVLMKNGTVESKVHNYKTSSINSDKTWVSSWKNIIDIREGRSVLVALKSDGTLICAYKYNEKLLDVAAWHDIISIEFSPSGETLVGLMSDGTVVHKTTESR